MGVPLGEVDVNADCTRTVVLLQDELASLMLLPPWYLRLFVHLIQLSDPRSGQGQTSYTELQELLTPLQPRSGPKFDVPTAKAVRTALDRFVEMGVMTRSSGDNASSRVLRFAVATRG